MPAWLAQLGQYDEQLLVALVVRRRSVLDLVMRGITRLADPTVVIAAALLLAGGLVPELQGAGWVGLVTLAVSHTLVQILKRTFVRTRPEPAVGLESLLDAPDRFSFPSGHAAAAFSLFVPLAVVLPLPWAAAALALAFLVGISRCYLGLHYPGDVLAGWLLAAGTMYCLANPVLRWVG